MNKRKISMILLIGGFILSPLLLVNNKILQETHRSNVVLFDGPQGIFTPANNSQTGENQVTGTYTTQPNNLFKNNGNSVPQAFQSNDSSEVVNVPSPSSSQNENGVQSNTPNQFNNYDNTGRDFTYENWSEPYKGTYNTESQVAQIWDQYQEGGGNNQAVPLKMQSFYGFNNNNSEPIYYNYANLADSPYMNKIPIIKTLGDNRNQFMCTRGSLGSTKYDEGMRINPIPVGQYVRESPLSLYFNQDNYNAIVSFISKNYTDSFKNNKDYRQTLNVTTKSGSKETLVYGEQNNNYYLLAYPTNNQKGMCTILNPEPVVFINESDAKSYDKNSIMDNSQIEYINGTNDLSTFIVNPIPQKQLGMSMQAFDIYNNYFDTIVPQIQDVYKINSLQLSSPEESNNINLAEYGNDLISGLGVGVTVSRNENGSNSSSSIPATLAYNGISQNINIPYTINSSLSSNEIEVNGKKITISKDTNVQNNNQQVPNVQQLSNNQNNQPQQQTNTTNKKPNNYIKDFEYIATVLVVIVIIIVLVGIVRKEFKNKKNKNNRWRK